MALTPTLPEIRRDVAIVMAKTVIAKTRFNEENYSNQIVPSQPPPKGFGSRTAFWAYILGIVEARLEDTNPRYAVFNVNENFVRRSRTAPIRVTNRKIAEVIQKGLLIAEDSDDEN